MFALPEVEERAGTVAHPAERAIWLRDELPVATPDAFLGNREIGHFHPWDGSLHIVLAPEVHPVALAGLAPTNRVMLYGPREEGEVEVLLGLIVSAVKRATVPSP